MARLRAAAAKISRSRALRVIQSRKEATRMAMRLQADPFNSFTSTFDPPVRAHAARLWDDVVRSIMNRSCGVAA